MTLMLQNLDLWDTRGMLMCNIFFLRNYIPTYLIAQDSLFLEVALFDDVMFHSKLPQA